MRWIAMFALTVFFINSADQKKQSHEREDGVISGACYFVINTCDEYVIHRARQTVVHGGKFYQDSFKKVVEQLGPMVSFHDKNTEVLVVRMHKAPFEQIETWQKKLDPDAKIAAHELRVYPRCMKVSLHDKRKDHIADVAIDEWQGALSENDKQEISMYADISLIPSFKYDYRPQTNAPLATCILISSYRPYPVCESYEDENSEEQNAQMGASSKSSMMNSRSACIIS